MKLTAATVKTLTLPSGADDKTFWDDELGGFGLRLRAGGAARYVIVRCRQQDQKRTTKRITLGTTALLDVSKARSKAKDLLASVRLGGDPASKKREARAKSAETFRAILPRYLAKMQIERRPRSFKELERHLAQLRQAAAPARPGRNRSARSLALISGIAERNGPSAAIHAHGSLSGYFVWLIREGLLDENAAAYANKPKARPARSRVISADELRQLWAALGDDDYGDIVRLLTYTACRRGEIGGLLWDEFDLDDAVVELSASRMKNRSPHLFPLSAPALAILRKRARDHDHVFGHGSGGFQGWVGAAGHSTVGSPVRVRLGPCTICADWLDRDARGARKPTACGRGRPRPCTTSSRRRRRNPTIRFSISPSRAAIGDHSLAQWVREPS